MSIESLKHTDFELEQYVQEVFHEVNSMAYSDEDGALKKTNSLEYIMELAEAGETEVFDCALMRESL
jgi:hypothetical protein